MGAEGSVGLEKGGKVGELEGTFLDCKVGRLEDRGVGFILGLLEVFKKLAVGTVVGYFNAAEAARKSEANNALERTSF